MSKGGRYHQLVGVAGAALLAVLVAVPVTARAQFGLPMAVPTEDFTWRWGRRLEAQSPGPEDINMYAADAGFRCQLRAKLSPASSLTGPQLREFERQLASALFFIQAAATEMYNLDSYRQLDWATLACTKPDDEVDAATRAEREDKARARAERARERRRSRSGE